MLNSVYLMIIIFIIFYNQASLDYTRSEASCKKMYKPKENIKVTTDKTIILLWFAFERS